MVNKNRLIKEFTKLVEIDNPSFQEKEMGEYIKKKLIQFGFQVTQDNAGTLLNGNCGNIYGYLPGALELSPLLFCVHMDAVEPSKGKVAVVDQDGTIRSQGDTVLGADDCAGIVAILEALQIMIETKQAYRPLEVLFTVAEEVYCKGAAVFDYSNVNAQEAYVLDLTGDVGTAAYKAPTLLSFQIDIKGRAAHAGFAPEQGTHAILAAAKAIQSIPMGAIDEDTRVNIGVIAGGLASNIVPEDCTIKGEIRSYVHEKAYQQMDMVTDHFAKACNEQGTTMQVAVECACEAYETPKDHSVVRRFEHACEHIGIPTSLVGTFGGSDNGALSKHGIKGIVLATAMNECHSCNEYTTVAELVRIAEITYLLMASNE